MNLLLEIIVLNGFLLDALGVAGLGLLAMAAARLVREKKSWGGSMMAYGAAALLIARVYVLLAPHFVDQAFVDAVGPYAFELLKIMPMTLLTFGLAGVVWGLWGHEKWLKEKY
ncbi:hypothetical protein HZ994_05670 [Akkermansiaceae bacterium]|nr:hypothetical protein HZ994_05670 [Akkermansiaceae bacterium]